MNSMFHLAQMAAILDFIHIAMYKVLPDYITMADIIETRMPYTKSRICVYSVENNDFIVSSCTILNFVTLRCPK